MSLLSAPSYYPFEQTAPMRPQVSLEVVPSAKNWPTPMDECAFQGLAGDFVRLIRNSTEADDHALLVSFLAGAGAMMGRGGYFTVEDTRHAPNLFVTTVGLPAKSVKEMDATGIVLPARKDKTYLGIYELDGDTLKWCVDNRRMEHPTEFRSNGGNFMMILKRKK